MNAFRKITHAARAICLGIVVLLCSKLSVHAQVLQPDRFEKLQKNSDDYYNVMSLNKEGLALFRERDKYKNSNKMWELVILDTLLQEKKTIDLEIKERHKMIGYEVVSGSIFLLYRTGEATRSDFELIQVKFTGEETRYTIKPDLDFKITHFIKTGNSLVFGGYVTNEPTIFLYDLPTGHIKVVPGFFQKDTELIDLRSNLNETFNTVLIDRGSKGERNLTFRTFDGSGNILLDDKVPIDENKTLQAGITSTLEREDLVVAGTWGERNAKQSTGFFTLRIDPFADQKINFTDFGKLQHYVDYLNSKRAARIKELSKDAAESGQIPNFVSYVMPYKIVDHQHGFVLLAEAYTPTSGMGSYPNGPYGANPYYYNPYGFNPYFPGYYYPGMSRMYRPYGYTPNTKSSNEIKPNETVVMGFDGNGKILWDYSLKIEDLKAASVEQVGDFSLHNSKLTLIYKKESELIVKSVILTEEPLAEVTEKIKTSDPIDEIRSEKEYEGGVRHWYNNTFYVWGYQTIRNVTKEDRVRDVFYVNKVVVH
jgi:hypothetical protein